jgi:hypothetical protein
MSFTTTPWACGLLREIEDPVTGVLVVDTIYRTLPHYPVHCTQLSNNRLYFICPFCVRVRNKDGTPRKGSKHIHHYVSACNRTHPRIQFTTNAPCIQGHPQYSGFEIYVTSSTGGVK